jgi:energy-coupling factor transporter transmembrane protein EcfT
MNDVQASNPSTSSSPPWYESNLLWGSVSILLFVLGSFIHNLFWLLIPAWLTLVFAFYVYTKTHHKAGLFVALGSMVSGVLLLVLFLWLYSSHKTQPQMPSSAEDPQTASNQSQTASTASIQKDPLPPQAKLPRQRNLPQTKPAQSPIEQPQTAPPLQSPPQICPNGICIGGSNNGIATVNNYAPPARRVPEDIQTACAAALSQSPGNVSINAIANDAEAYRLAQDFYSIFHNAKWSIDPDHVVIFLVGGGAPTEGVLLTFKGEAITNPGVQINVPLDSSIARFGMCLQKANLALSGKPGPDMDANRIGIFVGPRPTP